MYHMLSRVKSGGGAAYLFSVAGRIACKDASLFDAFSGPWTSSSTFYKLRYIERLSLGASGPPCPVRRAHGRCMEERDNLLTHHRQLCHRLLARAQGAHDKLRSTSVDVLLDPLGNVRGRPDGTDRGEGHIRPRAGDERGGLRDRLLPIGSDVVGQQDPNVIGLDRTLVLRRGGKDDVTTAAHFVRRDA